MLPVLLIKQKWCGLMRKVATFTVLSLVALQAIFTSNIPVLKHTMKCWDATWVIARLWIWSITNKVLITVEGFCSCCCLLLYKGFPLPLNLLWDMVTLPAFFSVLSLAVSKEMTSPIYRKIWHLAAFLPFFFGF